MKEAERNREQGFTKRSYKIEFGGNEDYICGGNQ